MGPPFAVLPLPGGVMLGLGLPRNVEQKASAHPGHKPAPLSRLRDGRFLRLLHGNANVARSNRCFVLTLVNALVLRKCQK